VEGVGSWHVDGDDFVNGTDSIVLCGVAGAMPRNEVTVVRGLREGVPMVVARR
jgi:hypothetical protein